MAPPDYYIPDGLTLRHWMDSMPVGKHAVFPVWCRILKGAAAPHLQGRVIGNIHPDSIVFEGDACTFNSVRQPIQYKAPEEIRGGAPSLQSDVYSLGLVLFEMAAGRLPEDGDSLPQVLPGCPTKLGIAFKKCITRKQDRWDTAWTIGAYLEALYPEPPTQLPMPAVAAFMERWEKDLTNANVARGAIVGATGCMAIFWAFFLILPGALEAFLIAIFGFSGGQGWYEKKIEACLKEAWNLGIRAIPQPYAIRYPRVAKVLTTAKAPFPNWTPIKVVPLD